MIDQTRTSGDLESASHEVGVNAPRETTRLGSFAFCLLVGLFVMPGAAAAQHAPPEYAVSYHEPFKGPPKKADDFTLIGADAGDCVQNEPDGLRITLPAGTGRAPTGVATAFGVAGDFEITVGYEVFEESSITVRIRLDKPAAKDKFGQSVVPDASIAFNKGDATLPLFLQIFTVRKDAASLGDRSAGVFAVKEKTGRFRLVRTGEKLSYHLSEGHDKEFQLLTTHSFGAEALRDIQIYGQTGRNPTLDVRFSDLHIRAASLPRNAAAPASDAKEYREPFKGPPKKAADFVLIGKNADKYVKYEPDGLRVTLPAGALAWQPTGVATAFGVVGDFDVSVRYEILAEPEPADAGSPAVGTRISLTANVGGINVNDASIRRKVSPFAPAHVAAYQSADKLTDYFPVKAKTGRLRLVRTGDKIAYYLSEGAEKAFKLLTTHPFNGADVREIQISAQTSGPNAALDARFSDLRINAKSLWRKSAPSKTQKANEPPSPRTEKVVEPQVPTKNYAATYEQSFKSNSAKPAAWNFTAAAAEEFVRFEPAGLRLTMPDGAPGERRGAGIQTAFGVKGDFEITLHFEFLTEPAPADIGKFATRLLMGVALDTPNFDTPAAEVATLNRSLLSDGKPTFTTWMRNRESPKGALGGKPATGTTGRLRLVRSGDELFCLVSVGADQAFTLVKTYRFGTENVKRVALTGMTGHEKAMLDVRLTDFRIRADAIPGAPAAGAVGEPQPTHAPATPPQEGGRAWLVAGLLVGLVFALIGVLVLGAWLFLRSRGPSL